MADRAPTMEPLASVRHRVGAGSRRIDATVMLTVYLVLLLGLPSGLTVANLNSYGNPSTIFGLVLLIWWLFSRLQRLVPDVGIVRQPTRLAFGGFVVVVLLGFAASLLRGMPTDQISPAMSAVVRLLSWSGVFLVTLDGVRTVDDLARLARRLSIAGGVLAGLGLLQFFTHQSWLDWFTSIPGLSYDSDSLIQRAGFTRASGTASHPLEYAVALNATLPIALFMASARGLNVKSAPSGGSWRWWLAPMLIMVASLIAVSRSAIIGLAVAVFASLPALPKRLRGSALAGVILVAAIVTVAVPGILYTTFGLFAGASTDSSTQSRTDALDHLRSFMAPSPFIGNGFGTFLPRYYIFDNEWALLLIEVGFIGAFFFLALVVAAMWSAAWASRVATDEMTARLARSLLAAMLVTAVLFAFFDALSFGQAAGLFFLLAGLCGSALAISTTDARRSTRRLWSPVKR
jgi:hypothetical protein